METKEHLVNNIKEWIKLDNEISDLKAQVKEKTNKKKGLTENLVTVMKTNKIDCFDINGGALVYKSNKVKKPINAKHCCPHCKVITKQIQRSRKN